MDNYGKDIADIKTKIVQHDERFLRYDEKFVHYDEKIDTINKTLDSIQDNTLWIKRTITKAIITAFCTAIIGGAIAIFYAQL